MHCVCMCVCNIHHQSQLCVHSAIQSAPACLGEARVVYTSVADTYVNALLKNWNIFVWVN